MGRRLRRSAHTPANSPASIADAEWVALNIPIWAGVDCRVRTAVRGSARAVICEPKSEIVCPAHSFRKSGCRQSPLSCGRIWLFLMVQRDSQTQLLACFDTFVNVIAPFKIPSSFARFGALIGVSGRR